METKRGYDWRIFRKFWEGLDNMAYYWDTSLDKYSSSNPEATDDAHQPKSATLPLHSDTQSQISPKETGSDDMAKIESNFDIRYEAEPRKKAKTSDVSDNVFTQSLNSNGFSSQPTAAYMSSISPSRMLPARTRAVEDLKRCQQRVL